MEQLLKQVLRPLEKKGERELQRASTRLQRCLAREAEKLLESEGGAEPAAGSSAGGCSAEHDGLGAAARVLTDPERIRDLAEALGTDVPPESAATAVQSEPLPAGAAAGAAVVLRCPEVSEIFQSQPLVEGSRVAFSCFIAGYFPQELTVTWLRRERGDSVATPIEDSADYTIVPKETCAKDRESYQQMVTLSFTPVVQRDQGAEYICQVEHVALQTPIERNTGTLEVKGVGIPNAKEVVPDPREVTPVFKEVAPDTQEVTPVSKEVAPNSRGITPDSREFKPISREDREDAAGGKEMHFIDRHREQLIQRVTLVEGVLDKLMGDDVLDSEQYLTITAERTNPMKMRKLYEFMLSWNKYCKDRLYEALKDKCKFLVADLEGE